MSTIEDTRNHKILIKEALNHSFNYKEYRDLVLKLAEEGKTTGPVQSPGLIEYTRLNNRRMKRWDKTFKSNDLLHNLKYLEQEVLWLVITESWCGDAAPIVPIINKVADSSDKITLRIVLRDEHKELISYFHTNGSLSIPKLIMLNPENFDVLGTWGPRPSQAAELAEQFKLVNKSLTPEFKEDLQHWYNNDKGKNLIEDLMRLLSLE